MENSDDQYWKWGIFYFNKNDRRIFPPKRNPSYGWTVNFANLRSILAFLTFLIFLIFVIYLIEIK